METILEIFNEIRGNLGHPNIPEVKKGSVIEYASKERGAMKPLTIDHHPVVTFQPSTRSLFHETSIFDFEVTGLATGNKLRVAVKTGDSAVNPTAELKNKGLRMDAGFPQVAAFRMRHLAKNVGSPPDYQRYRWWAYSDVAHTLADILRFYPEDGCYREEADPLYNVAEELNLLASKEYEAHNALRRVEQCRVGYYMPGREIEEVEGYRKLPDL